MPDDDQHIDESVIERNKRAIRVHFAEVFNERRLDLLDETTARDMLNHASMPFRTSRDRPRPYGGLKDAVLMLVAAFPDLTYTIEDLIAVDDYVVARVRMRGRNEWSFQGLPPTGKSVDVEQIHIFRMREGRMVEHWAGRNDLTALIQLGLYTPPRDEGIGSWIAAAIRGTGDDPASSPLPAQGRESASS
jgi:predicted ester cyclase